LSNISTMLSYLRKAVVAGGLPSKVMIPACFRHSSDMAG